MKHVDIRSSHLSSSCTVTHLRMRRSQTHTAHVCTQDSPSLSTTEASRWLIQVLRTHFSREPTRHGSSFWRGSSSSSRGRKWKCDLREPRRDGAEHSESPVRVCAVWLHYVNIVTDARHLKKLIIAPSCFMNDFQMSVSTVIISSA